MKDRSICDSLCRFAELAFESISLLVVAAQLVAISGCDFEQHPEMRAARRDGGRRARCRARFTKLDPAGKRPGGFGASSRSPRITWRGTSDC